MLANKLLCVATTISGLVVIPLMLVSTSVVGILITFSFGILLIPISVIWILLLSPLLAGSWLTTRVGWLRTPIGILGIPLALIADIYVTLIPSMGEKEARAAKIMLAQSWPYTWECWRFQGGELDLYDGENSCLLEVLERITQRVPLMERTMEKLIVGAPLDDDC